MKIFPLCCLCVIAVYANPPPVPGAGVIERELEKEYEAEPIELGKQVPSIQIDIPDEQLKIPAGECVDVKRIEVRGAESIRLSVIEGFKGRKLCLREIYEICAKIDAEYAKQGFFLARAFPPAQKVERGVLVIQVMEGCLGRICVEGERFYSERFIQSYFARFKGKGLRYDAFMRALLLLNEHSDLVAGAIFTKGKEVGTADVVIRVNDRRPTHLYLNANNYGKDLTTNFRLGARLDAGSLLTYGDRLSIAEVVGFPINALYFTDVVYRVPVSRNGDFVELSYLYSKFKIEELLSLHLKGVSNIGTFKVTHALKRTTSMSADLFGYFDVKQFQNYVLGSLASFDKLRVVTLGSLIDRFATRNGRDYLNVRMGVGIPDFLGAMSAVSDECSRRGAGGLFVKVNGDYDRLQVLRKDWILAFHGSGQWSPYKLAVPEQVYIGGADTVRGFPLAVALGDSGYYGNVEFRFPPFFIANQRFFRAKKKIREVMQGVAFLDTGGTFFYGGSNTFLWGSGVGLRLRGIWNLGFSLDVGFPLNRADLSKGTMFYIKVTGQPF